MLKSYQKECYRKLRESRDLGDEKYLVLMFCGTGKLWSFHTFMRDFTFSVAVFPTLALVDQNLDFLGIEKKTTSFILISEL
jgi:superfamily II DNA or RNA helicase